MIKLHQLFIMLIWLTVMTIWKPVVSRQINKYSEAEAAEYLDNTNRALGQWTNRVIKADWNWLTNLTNENADKKVLYFYIKYKKIIYII